jgi:hypothetical protein
LNVRDAFEKWNAKAHGLLLSTDSIGCTRYQQGVAAETSGQQQEDERPISSRDKKLFELMHQTGAHHYLSPKHAAVLFKELLR